MHDASGKISSGVLNGNINQYGDYDQCLNVNVPTTASSSSSNDPSLQGRYCLAGIQPSVASTALLQHVFSLVQSHGMLKSQLGDVSTAVFHCEEFDTRRFGMSCYSGVM